MEFLFLDGEQASQIDPTGITWPADTVVLCAVEGDQVVARSAILNLPVVEGSWVSPEKRGTSLAFRMLREVETIYRATDKTHSMAMAADDQPEVGEYLERVGYERMPVTMYTKKLEAV